MGATGRGWGGIKEQYTLSPAGRLGTFGRKSRLRVAGPREFFSFGKFFIRFSILGVSLVLEKKGVIFTKEAIAKVLGVSERRVGQLVKDNIIEEFSPGHFKLIPTIRAYIQFLQNTKNEERERLTRIKSDTAALD